MTMKKITLFSLLALSLNSFAQVSYSTRCVIKDGTAYGYVDNLGTSFTINGTVWFHFYDDSGRFMESEDEHEYELVTFKSSEEIEQTNLPLNANQCFFDIKDAIKEENYNHNANGPAFNPYTSDYSTSCEIKDGVAHGYVNNRGDGFFIDETVWFHFYDCNGNFIESNDEFESEHVWSKSIEEIEHTDAPSRACSCAFEVKKK